MLIGYTLTRRYPRSAGRGELREGSSGVHRSRMSKEQPREVRLYITIVQLLIRSLRVSRKVYFPAMYFPNPSGNVINPTAKAMKTVNEKPLNLKVKYLHNKALLPSPKQSFKQPIPFLEICDTTMEENKKCAKETAKDSKKVNYKHIMWRGLLPYQHEYRNLLDNKHCVWKGSLIVCRNCSR